MNFNLMNKDFIAEAKPVLNMQLLQFPCFV